MKKNIIFGIVCSIAIIVVGILSFTIRNFFLTIAAMGVIAFIAAIYSIVKD